MRGSEYIAARAAITALGVVAGGAVVAVTALFVAPRIASALSAVLPGPVPSLAALSIGLFVVLAVAVLMRRVLDYGLVRFEQWVIRYGGIED
jgi:hypothetical protein